MKNNSSMSAPDARDIPIHDTRIVGEDGMPLTVYHGTDVVFDRFHPSVTGAEGPGIYLSDEPHEYGDLTLEAQVLMRNPFFFYPSDESFDAIVNGELIDQVLPPDVAKMVVDRMDQFGMEAYGTEVQDALKAKGHDGIVMVCPFGEPKLKGVSGSCVFIAFDPDQVVITQPAMRRRLRP